MSQELSAFCSGLLRRACMASIGIGLVGAACAQTTSPAPQATEPAIVAPVCDAACVRVNMERASQLCARPIEAQAPIDYEWMTRPFTGLFQEADQSDAKTSVVAYRGDSIRFQNPQKEWIRVSYECRVDVAKQVVVGVRIRPGRLEQPPRVSAAAPVTAKPAQREVARKAQPSSPAHVNGAALAAAIAQAAAQRQKNASAVHAKPSRRIRVGETSAIEITQMRPR